jgi:ParB family chromosome partitioning protein
MNIVNINVDKLIISDINVRKTQINEIEELASSIDDIGLINPISVRKIESNDKYEIIAGQRRYLAMKSLNKHTIPCIIITVSNKIAEEISLIENIQKNNLSNCDKVKSYSKLCDTYDIDKVKNLTKVSKGTINKYLKIKDLPTDVLEKLDIKDKSKITIDIAIELVSLSSSLPELDLTEVIEKITPLKSKNKLAVIKLFLENNLTDIDDFDELVDNYSDEKKTYKGPFVFDSKEQKNLLIPEDMYDEIINLIKEKNEDITYF